jgi:hypothetical protein
MSKENSQFEISALMLSASAIVIFSLGSLGLNALRSVTGNPGDFRGVFRDSKQLNAELEQKNTNSINKKPTLEQFRELRDLSKHE